MSFLHFTAKFLSKKIGYGYDISGEVQEGSGPRAEQENINDIAEPQDHHETPRNPANMSMDSEAEKEFPELQDNSIQQFLPSRSK